MFGIYNVFYLYFLGFLLLKRECEAVKPQVLIEVAPSTAIKIGGKITLTCRVSGSTVPTAVNWYHEEIQITPSIFLASRNLRERYLLDSSVPGIYKINILNAKFEDSGLWRCVVEVANAVPPVQERRTTISIGVPDIYSLTPHVEVNLNQIARLQCNVTGEPEPLITWKRIAPVTTLPNGQRSLHGYVLQIPVRRIQDGGIYECQAKNVLGTHKRTVAVNIKHAPIIESNGAAIVVVRGWLNIPVNITCNFHAYPIPRITWYHNNAILKPNGRRVMIVTTETDSVVMLQPVTTDFGTYQCFVQNELGSRRQTMQFKPAVPPLPPANVRIGSASYNQVIILFDVPPFDGGLPINTYRVVYQMVGKRTSLSKRFFVGQNTIITNLSPFTSYYVKIAAGNAVGYGNYSAELLVTTSTKSLPMPTKSPFRPNEPHYLPTKSPLDTTAPSTTKVKKKPGQNASMAVAIVVGSLVALFIGGILILIVSSLPAFKWRRRRSSEQRLCNQRSFVMSQASFLSVRTDMTFRPMSVQYDELGNVSITTTKEYVAETEFPRDRLTVGAVIGTGSFGEVLRGEAVGIIKDGIRTTVALKTLKDNATETDRQDFFKELGIMKQLRPHPNIVTLFGCCTGDDGPVYIVMEYLPNNNLLMHLRNSRQRIENMDTHRASIRTTLQPTDLIRYAYEIANGMSYLATMMCIHRDLAARNILLSRDGVCKLSDFGLARDVEDGGVYQRKTQGRVPIRWMALESLLDNVYTIQSDVWSFGVLIWEVVTIGSYPYPGVSSKRLIRDLQKGYRMPKPEHCKEEVYAIMTDCWKADPGSRPNFDELRHMLESILIESRNYLVLDFDECLYDYTYCGSSDVDNTSSLERSNNI